MKSRGAQLAALAITVSFGLAACGNDTEAASLATDERTADVRLSDSSSSDSPAVGVASPPAAQAGQEFIDYGGEPGGPLDLATSRETVPGTVPAVDGPLVDGPVVDDPLVPPVTEPQPTTPGTTVPGTVARPNGSPAAMRGRLIVRTGNVRVTTDDVASAGPRAQAIIEGFGGYVSNQQASFSTEPSVSITFRIPAESFDQAMSSLSGVGKLVEASINSDEVTAQAVDLRARLKTARAGRDRLIELTKTAKDTSALVELENQLVQRESDIEAMQAQLNGINDRVSLSTITMTIARTPEATKAATSDKPTFSGGLTGGWEAMKAIGALGAGFVGVLLGLSPLIVLSAMALYALRLWMKRRRRLAPPKPPVMYGPGPMYPYPTAQQATAQPQAAQPQAAQPQATTPATALDPEPATVE